MQHHDEPTEPGSGPANEDFAASLPMENPRDPSDAMEDFASYRAHERFTFDPLSHKVIGCAIEVHRALGPGLLESSYRRCLSHELDAAGIRHVCEAELPIHYKGLALDSGYRIDILCESELIVELKSVKAIEPIHVAQLITYLKLSSIKAGLLMNFNTVKLKNGIKRYVL